MLEVTPPSTIQIYTEAFSYNYKYLQFGKNHEN